MVTQNWIDLINDFNRLGGTAENIYQRIGKNGRGLFPIEEKENIKIFIPKSLFIPLDSLELINNEIKVVSNSLFENDTNEFLNSYYKEFSWGNGGKDSVEIFENSLKELPVSVKEILYKNKIINFKKRHKGDWRQIILSQFFSSRSFVIGNKSYLIPIAELANHDPKSLPFNKNMLGINIKTRNPTLKEITARYACCGSLMMFLKYGITSEEPICFSLPFEINIPELSLILVCSGMSLVDDKIRIKRNNNKLIITGLPIGCLSNSELAKSYFLNIIKKFKFNIKFDIFKKIIQINLNKRKQMISVLNQNNLPISKNLIKIFEQEISMINNTTF